MALSAVFLLSPNCLTHMESPINPETPQKPLHQSPNQNSTHRYLSSGQRREFLWWGKGERHTGGRKGEAGCTSLQHRVVEYPWQSPCQVLSRPNCLASETRGGKALQGGVIRAVGS